MDRLSIKKIQELGHSAIDDIQSLNWKSAEQKMMAVLAIDPHEFNALNLLAYIFVMQGELAQAISRMEQARSIQPLDPGLLINLGKAYFNSGSYEKSIQIYEIYKNNHLPKPEVNLDIIIANEKLGNLQLALDLCLDLTKNYQEYTAAWKQLNVIYIKLKRLDESKIAALKVLEIASFDPDAWIALGNSLYELGDYKEAIHANERALELSPESSIPWTNIGNCYLKLGMGDRAIESHLHSIQLEPESEDALYNLGVTYGRIGDLGGAIDSYDRLLKLSPGNNQAKFNKGLALLQLADFERGWPLYEHRWDLDGAIQMRHTHIDRLDSLDGIKGKKILVWHEQGYGDTIQFCRFVFKLIEYGAIVTFEVPKPLTSLLKIQLQCKVAESIMYDEQFDFQIPLLSLPLLFNTDLDSISSAPFFKVNPSKLEFWKERLHLSTNKLNIGFAFSGNVLHKNDHNRSMPVSFIKPLLNDAKVFILQKQLSAVDRSFLNENSEIVFLGPEIEDFSDTAAIIQNLELIISVDTSLIHLAGSLNKKALLLLPHIPDWRWLRGRLDTPWYQSISIIHQESEGDWNGSMSKVVNHAYFLDNGTRLPG